MSLNTVLKIGKALKKDSVRHFRHIVKPSYKFDDVVKLSIEIDQNYDFNFNSLSILTNENLIEELSFLKFQTADKDTNPIKYIFGDILYGIKKGGKETGGGGWYKTTHKEKEDKKTGEVQIKTNSFYEGKVYFEKMIESFIDKFNGLSEDELGVKLSALPLKRFNENFEANKSNIENVLKFHRGIYQFLNEINEADISISELLGNVERLRFYQAKASFYQIESRTTFKSDFKKLIGIQEPNWEEICTNEKYVQKLLNEIEGQVFVHFKFPEFEHWYQHSESVELIINQIFNENTSLSKEGFVFNKSLYPPLCSGDSSNDIQFPNFDNETKYKAQVFTQDDLENLFYGFSLATKSIVRPFKGLDIRILPNSRDKELLAEDYIKFYNNEFKGDEERLKQVSSDNLFPLSLISGENNITTFDMVFTDTSGQAHVDLLEISGVEKSSLYEVNSKIQLAKNQIFNERQTELFFLKKDLPNLSIIWSLKNLLGIPLADEDNGTIKFSEGKNGSYFKTHVIKILPKLYTRQYFEDQILLPAFINNVEYSVRKGINLQFQYLKYDFKFLLLLQKELTNSNNMEKIQSSLSYESGLLLGQLAKQFSGDKTPINSFDKTFAGNLTRHISTLKELQKTKTSLEEKLARWELAKYTTSHSSELAEKINQLKEGTYDKHECAFGFFESYFKPNKKKSLVEKLENLIGDYKTDEENGQLIEELESLLSKNQEN